MSGCASQILLDFVEVGREVIRAKQPGMAWSAAWSSALYCVGETPVIRVKLELNDPSDVQPTVMQASVTPTPPRSKVIARSMRRVIR